MKLGNYKDRKVEETGFSKKFFIWRYSQKGLQISIGWLVGWLTGWLVGWLIGWLVGWLVGWQRSFLRNGSINFFDFLHKVRVL